MGAPRAKPAACRAAPPAGATAASALAVLALLAGTGPALAQQDVFLDGSLNLGGPMPAPSQMVGNSLLWTLTEGQGTLDDANLFFSFLRFGVADGDRVSFQPADAMAPPPLLERVIARVTGGMLSRIDGTLSSSFDADFFLLNPSGIFFGPRSQIDVNGSTFLSTADELRFDGFVLETGVATTPPSLSSQSPESFGFLSDDPAGITLDLAEGPLFPAGNRPTNFTVVGGPVTVRGNPMGPSADEGTIQIDGGTLAIAAVGSGGVSVPVYDIASLPARSLPDGALGVVSVGNGARLDASSVSATGGNPGTPSGRVVVRAGRFVLGAFPEELGGAPGVVGGEIIVRSTTPLAPPHALAVDAEATTSIEIQGGSEIAARTESAARVGGVRLAADEIEVRDPGTAVRSRTIGSAPGPDIAIDTHALRILDGATLESQALGTTTDAFGGDVQIVTTGPVLVHEATVASLASSTAPGGVISIESTGTDASLTVSGGTITSVAAVLGDGGDIDIDVEGPVVVTRGESPTAFGRIVSEGQVLASGGDVSVHAASISVDSALEPGEVGAAGAPNSQISAITQAFTAPGFDPVGGDITLVAPEIRLGPGGQVLALTKGAAPAGDVRIFGALAEDGTTPLPARVFAADGLSSFADRPVAAGVFADSAASATGDAGSVLVMADDVSLTNAAAVSARALVDGAQKSQGDAGSLTVLAQRVLAQGGPQGAAGFVVRNADGQQGGDLRIEASEEVRLLSAGVASASTLGTADAGTVSVAAPRIEIAGAQSGLFAQVTAAAPSDGTSGDGGDVLVSVGEELLVRDGGAISVEQVGSDGVGRGQAGNITIEGGGSVALSDGGEISASVFSPRPLTPGEAPGANITLRDLENVSLASAARMTAETRGRGQGGSISIARVGQLALEGAAEISTQALAGSSGAGGNVAISQVDQVSLDSGATISAATASSGAGGSIAFDQVGQLSLDGGSSLSAATSGTGPGGAIRAKTSDSTRLDGASSITARSTSNANAGSIEVDAGRVLSLEGGSAIETEALSASGGSIRLSAADQISLTDSRVTTSVATGAGGGGDIGIPVLLGQNPADAGNPPAPAVFVMNRSEVRADAFDGNGGNILIQGGQLLISTESAITATSQGGGVNGTIEIEAPDAELAGQVTPLSDEFFDASQMMLPPCAARTSRAGSFVIQTRAAPRPPPDAPLGAALARAVQEGQQCTL